MLKLLNLLKDGRFHSGEALGAALGVSRSAVWKQLQHLETELNLTIHKVRGRGYQLAAPLALLEAKAIAEFAEGEQWPVFIHETIDSTNAEGLRLAGEGQAAPFLVLAERQNEPGYAHPPDTKWMWEFERSFHFTETADQRRAVLATTGLPSGLPVMDDPEGYGRLNLFAAADGVVAKVMASKGESLVVDQPIVEFEQ